MRTLPRDERICANNARAVAQLRCTHLRFKVGMSYVSFHVATTPMCILRNPRVFKFPASYCTAQFRICRKSPPMCTKLIAFAIRSDNVCVSTSLARSLNPGYLHRLRSTLAFLLLVVLVTVVAIFCPVKK